MISEEVTTWISLVSAIVSLGFAISAARSLHRAKQSSIKVKQYVKEIKQIQKQL
ncbi:hypothetical protein ACWA2C_16440 [Priestia megaterium]